MAYDEAVAERVRVAIGEQDRVVEKKMFGGVAFMVRGNMSIGVQGDRLMVRVGPEQYSEAVMQPYARPMDFTGREIKGYVYVDPPGFAEADDLAAWVERSLNFVLTLPAK